MYETIKNYISRYSWIYYICAAVFILLFGRFIFGGNNDSDHKRAVEHMERAKDEQRNSLELNQSVSNSVERSASLNREAVERISRAQEYQQRASQSLEQGTKRLDEAKRLLERNAELIERVEQGHQAQQGDGQAIKAPTEHVGAD